MTPSHLYRQSLAALALLTIVGFASAQAPARFETFNDGTVRDSQTNLHWASKDNGGDIDWASAQLYCQSVGAGWGLPTTEQLLQIYGTGAHGGQDCIGVFNCKITPLIAISGLAPWSSQSKEPNEAWYLYLGDGQSYAYKASDTQGKRALCVRS